MSLAELGQGATWDEALDSMQKRVDSECLRALVRVLKRQRLAGGNLADQLEPLACAITERAGSDGANEAQKARLAGWAGTEQLDWSRFAAAEPQPWAPDEAFNPLLEDPDISEIMIDGPYALRVERRGRLEDVPMHFLDGEHLLDVLRKLLAPFGIRLDDEHLLTDTTLADGTRISIALPPLCPIGPAVVMRKVVRQDLDIERLIGYGFWTAEIVAFLRACIAGRCNILVCGGTGSGKTTLTNLQQLAAAFQLIITLNRLADGSRRVTHITEIVGMERDQIILRDLMTFEEQESPTPGRGQFRWHTPPSFLNRLRRQGLAVPDGLWDAV